MVKTASFDSTQDRIRHAAKKVFLERGMAGARMQDIADEAGINKALLHYYFSSKELLFEKIFREAFEQFIPKIQTLFNSEISLQEKIRLFCVNYIDLLVENPYLPLFVLSEMHQDPGRFEELMFKDRKPPFLRLVQLIDEESLRGNIRPMKGIQFLMNLLSMCIFPFVSKPLLMRASQMNETQFRALIEERKTLIPEILIASIRKP